MKRMVCVWLPDWSVDVMRRRKRLSNETIVLLVIAGLEDEVVRCCQKACQLGIVPGMSVSHARTLIGDRDKELFINTLDERQDALAMVRLARWAKRYSPRVMIDQSPSCGEGLILDVTGCTHLFGGMSVMVEQIATSLERFCVRSFVGCAGTIGCAWAASRYKGGQCVEPGGERSFLSSCPVTSLRLDLTCVASLHEVGLYDIGMLWGIPKAELADRFGLTLVRRLDQALGIGAEVVTWLDDDALPYVSQRFSGPVSSLETMSCVVHNLCKELSCVLHERSRGAVRLLLLCLGSDELEIRRELCVSQPVCDGEHWWSLLRLELEALEFFCKENNFGGGSGGVEEIIIQVLSWELMAYEQGAFLEKDSLVGGADGFGSSCISGSLLKGDVGFLADSLRSRVGDDCVWSMKSVATHLPENVSWFDASGSVDVEGDIFDNKLFRPSLMLESPELLEVLKFSDGGVPQHWRWRGIETKCILSDGPEVISEAWWQGFGNPRGRFYFRVQDASGCWLWIFWTQTNGSNLIEDGLWYLHGWWA